MIKKIYFKNFKSFKELSFEIKEQRNGNQIYLIYGENGAGKSNLVYSIYFLRELINSRHMTQIFQKLPSSRASDKKMSFDFAGEYLSKNALDKKLQTIKRLDSSEEMFLEYTFSYQQKDYRYKLIFNDQKLIYESLHAPLGKNLIKIYEINYIDKLNIYFNEMLFKDEYSNDIKKELEMYFGKHSLLSLIQFDLVEKNQTYIEDNVHKILLNFIDYLLSLSISYSENFEIATYKRLSLKKMPVLESLEEGVVKKNDLKILEKNEVALDLYFKSLYADIKQVFYQKDFKENLIEYRLFMKKIIGGTLIDIPFFLESRGTKKLLELFPFFMDLLEGETVVIDELDAGVHDVLVALLIEKLQDIEFPGQLIATTHNTMLLDIVNKNQVFILDVDDLGNKSIYTLAKSGVPIQPNHSLYNNYKKGVYGGVPTPGYFDFMDIKNCFKD